MNSPIVELKWPETIAAALNGIMRRISSRAQGLDPTKTVSSHKWECEIIGSLGETAFAKYSNLYNSFSINSFKMPDIGNVQVRATSCEKGHLLIRKNDPDDDPYVLMIGETFEWKICGWITGKQAKRKEWWRDTNGGAWWVPSTELEDISTLPEAKKNE